MFKHYFVSSLIFVVLFVCGTVGMAQSQATPKASAVLSSTSAKISPVIIDAKADDILRQTSEYLKRAKQFTFDAHVTFERVLESGQKLQFGRNIKVLLRRPDKLRVEIIEQYRQMRCIYDGKNFTILLVDKNVYARLKVPETIDKTFDFMMSKYSLDIPLADLYFSDPYESFVNQAEGMESGVYLGQDKVGKITCHHLAFQMKNIDWQIWIEESEELLPRKLLITYKTAPSMPQFCAFFSKWNLAPRFHANLFKFVAPDEAQEIEFLALRKKAKPKPNK